MFNDPRLPGRFRATSDQPVSIRRDLILEQAVNRFDSLSAESRSLIERYLVPPAYWGIVCAELDSARLHEKRRRPRAMPFPGPIAVLPRGTGRPWTARTFASGTTRRHDLAISSRPAISVTYAETAYGALIGAGFRPPLPDSSFWSCDGGDGRLDIYIMETSLGTSTGAVTVALNPINTGQSASAFIEISPTVISSADTLRPTVVHELMHAIQHGLFESRSARLFLDEGMLSPSGPRTSCTRLRWIRTSPLYAGRFRLQRAHMPLFYPNGYCDNIPAVCGTDTQGDLKMYAAYLFFQFMTQKAGPTAISQFFSDTSLGITLDPLAGDQQCPRLHRAGGLTEHWQKFSLALWNQPPLPTPDAALFPGWDGAAKWAGKIKTITVDGRQPSEADPVAGR